MTLHLQDKCFHTCICDRGDSNGVLFSQRYIVSIIKKKPTLSIPPQGLAAVFNISLGIVSWWTSKESERYNRLIQLRVFAFCLNILHAYITGPIVYQNEDVPLMAPGKTGMLR